MKVVTVYFDEKPIYRKLKEIFMNSYQEVMPDTELVVIEPGRQKRKKYSHKLDTAVGFIAAANYVVQQEEPCIVVDIDILWLRDVTDVFKQEFDLAVTVRDTKARYNTGFWAYTPHARKAVVQWKVYTEYYAENLERLHDEIWQHGGIDQIALRDTIKTNPELAVLELPCREWNAEQSSWASVDDSTRLLHIKSRLRQVVDGKTIDDPVINRLAKMALKYTEENYAKKKNKKSADN